MAIENKALLAISGDYYGNSEISVVIRNGVLYRSSGNDADVCVLFTDGTMKTYSPEAFDADKLIDQGAWQAWTFGPALLDGNGNILDSFNTTDYIYSENPRCSIGYVAPGHYKFVVVDGRNPGYSKGASLNELAQIMVDEGCMTAYNLDGGKSASMVYDGAYVNQPAQGGRNISDIIYLGE
jgi:exopolysaccharide biosynthesis protein